MFQYLRKSVRHVSACKHKFQVRQHLFIWLPLFPDDTEQMRSGSIWKRSQMWGNVPYWFAPCDALRQLGRESKCLVWVYNYERNWLINSFVNPCVSHTVSAAWLGHCKMIRVSHIQLISKWTWSIFFFPRGSLHIRDHCADWIKNICFLSKALSLFISLFLKSSSIKTCVTF